MPTKQCYINNPPPVFLLVVSLINAAALKWHKINGYIMCVYQLFPQIEEAMVQPLRESRDRYEELKQIDDAMNEVGRFLRSVWGCICLSFSTDCHVPFRCRKRKVRTWPWEGRSSKTLLKVGRSISSVRPPPGQIEPWSSALLCFSTSERRARAWSEVKVVGHVGHGGLNISPSRRPPVTCRPRP